MKAVRDIGLLFQRYAVHGASCDGDALRGRTSARVRW
jgi:hypothetical protein